MALAAWPDNLPLITHTSRVVLVAHASSTQIAGCVHCCAPSPTRQLHDIASPTTAYSTTTICNRPQLHLPPTRHPPHSMVQPTGPHQAPISPHTTTTITARSPTLLCPGTHPTAALRCLPPAARRPCAPSAPGPPARGPGAPPRACRGAACRCGTSRRRSAQPGGTCACGTAARGNDTRRVCGSSMVAHVHT